MLKELCDQLGPHLLRVAAAVVRRAPALPGPAGTVKSEEFFRKRTVQTLKRTVQNRTSALNTWDARHRVRAAKHGMPDTPCGILGLPT